jgi:hypothetical protein
VPSCPVVVAVALYFEAPWEAAEVDFAEEVAAVLVAVMVGAPAAVVVLVVG